MADIVATRAANRTKVDGDVMIDVHGGEVACLKVTFYASVDG